MNPVDLLNRSITVAAVLLAGIATSVIAEESCLECHKSENYRIENKKLYEYFQRYQGSVHGLLGIGCADCHGGDPQSTDLSAAHEGVMEKVSYRNIPDTCGSCHETQWQSFRESKHSKALKNEGGAPNCVTCHGSMDVDVYFTSIVKNTCVLCHNEETGNGPDVPAQAEHILSQINVIKGYRGLVQKYSEDPKLMAQVEDSYERVTHYWHGFDLHQVEVETEYLLRMLREEKVKVLQKKRQHD